MEGRAYGLGVPDKKMTHERKEEEDLWTRVATCVSGACVERGREGGGGCIFRNYSSKCTDGLPPFGIFTTVTFPDCVQRGRSLTQLLTVLLPVRHSSNYEHHEFEHRLKD
jgi:hypothetical protein